MLKYLGEHSMKPRISKLRRLFQFITRRNENHSITMREPSAFLIPDIERNSFCFTDGCGKISLGLARKVARNLGISMVNTL